MVITEEQFTLATGSAPRDDDMERANCPDAGKIGHWSCGWNHKRNLPRFMCGSDDEEPADRN